jgi:hypothetical protein
VSEQQPETLNVLRARRQQATQRPLQSRPAPEHRPSEEPYELPVPREGPDSARQPSGAQPPTPPVASKPAAVDRPHVAITLALDEATANLAVRVRRPLDRSLSARLLPLRSHGFRTSKAELVELLLWELDQAENEEVAHRLRRFREHAPR